MISSGCLNTLPTIRKKHQLINKPIIISPLVIALGVIYSHQAVAQTISLEQLANNQVQLQQQREEPLKVNTHKIP